MKQIIFFKKTCVLVLFVFIGNAYLLAQTPVGPYTTIVGTDNGSCNAGRIEGQGYFSFPVPTGLTLSQLNHLETDYLVDPPQQVLDFQIIVQVGGDQIDLRFEIGGPNTFTWTNSGNVASGTLYSEAQAQYGNAVILYIKLWNHPDEFQDVYFDNTIINNRTYNYDDCDQDGLLDIYDCAPANNGNNKVLVCHSGQTICVALPALQAHLDHGDYMGSCIVARPGNSLQPEEVSKIELKLYPNPADDQINIRNSNYKPLGTVSIYDISGKMIYNNFIGSSRATIDIKKFSPGVYWLRSDQMEKVLKFVKQ